MGNHNWRTVRLGEIARVVMGQSPDSKFYNQEGSGHKFLQGCAEFKKKFPQTDIYCSQPKKLAPPNSILFSVRAPVGRINFSDQEYCIGRGLSAIIPQEINLDYLYQYLLFKGEELRYLSQGSTFDSINSKELKNIELTIPESHSEQSKIATILSTVDKAIEQTEALIAKYQRIKTGLMQDLLTRGIDENGNIRSEETHEFKDSPLGRIPKEWEVVNLKSLYKNPIRDFGSFSTTKLITFLEEGIPFIKSEMIESGRVNWKDLAYISEDVHKTLNKSHVTKGLILFSKIGSALGKATVYEGELGECNSNAAVAKIEIDENKANNYFICYLMNFETVQSQIHNKIISLLPRINLGDINKFLIPKPSKMEQDFIVARIKSIDKKLRNEEATLSKFQKIKIGLMQDLLTGKVRVNHLIEKYDLAKMQ